MAVYTGEYYEHAVGGISKAVYYTFTPRSLMADGLFTPDEELYSLLIVAHRALGILEGMITNIPNRSVLLESAQLLECYYSKEIDYPGNSLHSVVEAYGCGEDMRAVHNMLQAQEAAFNKNIDLESLCDVYRIVKFGADAREHAGLRTTPVFLANSITNLRQYSPTAPEHVFRGMQDIFLYLQKDTSDTLVKAAMSHYQFEMIHPFESCNGIVGRILISQIMQDSDLKAASYLCLSEILYETRNDYFDLLSSTQKGGGYLRWIKYFVSAVYEAACRSVKRIEGYRKIVERDEEKILQCQPGRVQNVLAVFVYWKRYCISNIKRPAAEIGMSYNAVERAVTVMVELGILKQITQTPRYRKYMYAELAELYLGQPLKTGEV